MADPKFKKWVNSELRKYIKEDVEELKEKMRKNRYVQNKKSINKEKQKKKKRKSPTFKR